MADTIAPSREVTEQSDPSAESVVGKVRCIIETLAELGPVSLTELARESGISKTTTHRLCGELLAWGVLEKRGGLLALGERLANLGDLAPTSGSLVEVGRPFAADLFATFRVSVGLSVLEGQTLVRCVDKIFAVGNDSGSWMGTGGSAPAFCTAAGKAIVAFSPPDVRDAIVAQPLAAMAPYAISGRVRFVNELKEIRRTAVSWTRNEIRMNDVAIASPILTREHRVVGAISCVLGPADVDLTALVAALKRQANCIGHHMK